MDGDGLLGTPVDTGQAMAAMGPDDGSFGRTDDIAHGADAGTEAAGNAAVPVDGRRQPAFPGTADQAQVHEPGRCRRTDGIGIPDLPAYLIGGSGNQLIGVVQAVRVVADMAARRDGAVGDHRQDGAIRQGTLLALQNPVHRLERPAGRTAAGGDAIEIRRFLEPDLSDEILYGVRKVPEIDGKDEADDAVLDALAPFVDSRNGHRRIAGQFSQFLGYI